MVSQEERRGPLDFSYVGSQKDYKIPDCLGEVALSSLVPSANTSLSFLDYPL